MEELQRINVEELECQVQKHVVSFCKCLPAHVDKWRSLLEQAVKPVQSLGNLAEQQRHVKKAKIDYMDDFENAQSTLLYMISNRIEDEILTIKKIIESLGKSNNELKSKLFNLERSTLNLDFNDCSGSQLIRGSASQPPLSRLLQDGLDFLTFFLKSCKNINDSFRNLDLDDEKSVKQLQEAIIVNLSDSAVIGLIAITQYVDNEKAIL